MPLVPLGAVAAAFLEQACAIRLVSHTVGVGTIMAPAGSIPKFEDVNQLDDDPLRCYDADASAAMVTEVDRAHADGDTLGGVVEVVGYGLPPGLGSHVQWDRKLDGRLAQAVMSIPAIKGVEIGDGWRAAGLPGSEVHDAILHDPEHAYFRETNRSGGLEGGITTGAELVVRRNGAGQSTRYQTPGRLRAGAGIVVRPLIALMEDQVTSLRQLGIRADVGRQAGRPGGLRAAAQPELHHASASGIRGQREGRSRVRHGHRRGG